jgi:hypothetical protein
MKRFIAAKQVRHASPPAKIQKVGAATHRHMLAVVDWFARFSIDVRAGPAPQAAAGFDQRDAALPRSQGGSRRQSGQTASHDDHVRLLAG